MVTADEVGDVTTLTLTTDVNGERRQEACVADLIFDIPTIIETISRTMTLEPGDVIATGTAGRRRDRFQTTQVPEDGGRW